jgi:hypothetical protein
MSRRHFGRRPASCLLTGRSCAASRSCSVHVWPQSVQLHDTEEARKLRRDVMRWHLGHRVFTNRIGVEASGFGRSCISTASSRAGLAERVTVHGSGPCPFTRAAFRLDQR